MRNDSDEEMIPELIDAGDSSDSDGGKSKAQAKKSAAAKQPPKPPPAAKPASIKKPVREMSVKELRVAIKEAGLEDDSKGMAEKSEFIDLLEKGSQQKVKGGGASTKPAPAAKKPGPAIVSPPPAPTKKEEAKKDTKNKNKKKSEKKTGGVIADSDSDNESVPDLLDEQSDSDSDIDIDSDSDSSINSTNSDLPGLIDDEEDSDDGGKKKSKKKKDAAKGPGFAEAFASNSNKKQNSKAVKAEAARKKKEQAEKARKEAEEKEKEEKRLADIQKKLKIERDKINKIRSDRRKSILDKVPHYDKYVQNFCASNLFNPKKKIDFKKHYEACKTFEDHNRIETDIDRPISQIVARFFTRGVRQFCKVRKDMKELQSLRERALSSGGQDLPKQFPKNAIGKQKWEFLLKSHGGWGTLLDAIYTFESKKPWGQYCSWTTMKLNIGEQKELEELEDNSYALSGDFDDDRELSETRVHETSTPAADRPEEKKGEIRELVDSVDYGEAISVDDIVNKVLISMHVLKWINRDPNNPLVEVLRKRLVALAEGRTSYCLSKVLKHHSKGRPLWEAKLTSGDRILYTCEEVFGEDGLAKKTLLVWHVCHHDAVPTNMERIDNSYRRRNYREEEFGDAASDFQVVSNKEDLLLVDPMGNNMLRTYSVSTYDIDKLGTSSWKPSLQLTKHELEIVKLDKSVLLLGRGGTGKTYCLCSRMHRDITCSTRTITPVFVSYTPRLKENVRHIYESMIFKDNTIENETNLRYCTIKTMVEYIYFSVVKDVPVDGDIHDFKNESNKVTYVTFRDDFWGRLEAKDTKYKDTRDIEMHLTPLLAWTQIYSFIKGSCEAIKTDFLSLDEYLRFDRKRVRLSESGKRVAYHIFELYQSWIRESSKWDQTDYVRTSYKKLEIYLYKMGNTALFDKVYIDEVQDLTQAEISLLLLSTRLNTHAFFFAGDTAQSIVNGVSFRFEEIRNAFYMLTEGHEALARTQVLTTNFRSHDGILRVAGKVLDKLNETFEEAADKISKNVGLAQGQRPLYLSKGTLENIIQLIKGFPRVRLLTWDSQAKELEEFLNEVRDDEQSEEEESLPPINVFGFKNVKGLEFEDVAIVNFFCTKSKGAPMFDEFQQKCWKYLFTKSGKAPPMYPPSDMEVNLKILYTAITRTRSRLFFIEQEDTRGGESFFRFLNLKDNEREEPLAEKLNIDSYEGQVITPQLPVDFLWEGLEMAEMALGEDSELGDSINRFLAALKSFCYAKKIGPPKGVDDLILKVLGQIKVLKFEDMLRRRKSKPSNQSDVDSDVTNDLDIPDQKKRALEFEYLSKIQYELSKYKGLDIESIAAMTAKLYMELYMYNDAVRILDEYCKSSALSGLRKRISKMNIARDL